MERGEVHLVHQTIGNMGMKILGSQNFDELRVVALKEHFRQAKSSLLLNGGYYWGKLSGLKAFFKRVGLGEGFIIFGINFQGNWEVSWLGSWVGNFRRDLF